MDIAAKYEASDKQDEVERLRDVIKNLELENQLLRSRSKKTNIGDKEVVARTLSVVPLDSQPIDAKDLLVNVECLDFSDEETWLYKSPKFKPTAGASSWNPQSWLRSHVDSDLDFDFQQIRRMLISKLEELEQGSRRNNIDTRTFTRPKKRLNRPGLNSMAEVPLLTTSRGMSKPFTSKALTISETIDDKRMPLNTTVTTHCLDTTYLNANFQKLEEDFLNKHLVENTRNIMFQQLEDNGLNSTFRKSEDLLMQNDEWPSSNTNFSKILSEPHLNTSTELRLAPRLSLFKGGSIPDALHSTHNTSNNTELNLEGDRTVNISAHDLTSTVTPNMVDLNETFEVTNCNRAKDSPVPVLDGTFCVPTESDCDVHSTTKRTASCDSVGDEDYSSASDCSYGVTNGQNNDALGDVKNRARLQEESLKLTVSTPESNRKREAFIPGDLPSPIHHVSGDGNYGYQSDHSDHSSLAKSSRSSQRSSPAISPYGSTNMLASVNGYYMPAKPQMAGIKVLSQNAHVLTGQKSVHDAAIGNRPLSGLRAPAVRSQGVAGSSLHRPATGIPRPRSRIPAPKNRKD